MVKKYFLAPDFTTAPPPKGPIHLGSILRNLTEFDPLNRIVQTIPKTQLYPVDKKTRFEISLLELHSANSGLRAKALELLGLGANASIERTEGSSSVLSCQQLETFVFNPTDSYINDSLNDPDVRSFMRSRVPVYMVTGLKVARGASSTSSTSRTVALEADAGLVPSGMPVEVGVRAGYASSIEEGEKWDTSTDFIVAFKVRKIWLDRKDEVKHQEHTKKAVMQDSTPSSREPAFTIRSDDELTPEEVDEMFGKREDDI